jgi:DNA-directed RNA polymerase subunit K/omega
MCPPKQRHAATGARSRQRQRHGRAIFRIEAEHDLIISALIEIPGSSEI